MKYYLTLYVSTLLVMGVLDALWLGVIAREFYQGHIGAAFEFHPIPAVMFYLMYGVAILVFASGGNADKWQSVALYGALFGFFAYATYDLTNMATLKHWPTIMAIVDVAWGTFITATSATLGWLIARSLVR